jgi:hypothetical protein
MSITTLTTEQKKLRSLLYFISTLLMIIYISLGYYKLFDPTQKNIVNLIMVIMYGIIFFIGYRKKVINKSSLYFTLLFVAIVVSIALLNRKSWQSVNDSNPPKQDPLLWKQN